MDASQLQLIIPVAGIAAVIFAVYLARDVLARDKGPQAMQDVADTSQPSAAPPSEKAPPTYDPPHLRPSSSKVR